MQIHPTTLIAACGLVLLAASSVMAEPDRLADRTTSFPSAPASPHAAFLPVCAQFGCDTDVAAAYRYLAGLRHPS
jgi:hypothetical protein